MEKVWRLILDEANDPHINMAIDEAIMVCQAQDTSVPTLRIYKWLYPCISIGRFQNLDEMLNRQYNLSVVKRPTGGGVVFHDEFSFTYSIIYREGSFALFKGVSNSYRQIHNGILQGLKNLGINAALHAFERNGRNFFPSKFCFSVPGEFDIICGNKKIAGAAQRRRYGVVLHQGEVRIDLDVWPKWSYNVLKNAIVSGLSKQLEAKFAEGRLSEKERILAEEVKI
ncbi:MAG: hypothetical protein AMJ78_07010 [Omnitrophica WOR_2 bacterium SM23_29]|nr:MAG: hypothetical protein AMJ78_07010 [Omnitrophica WOR_2 bacterium SM23_29]